VAVSNDGRPNIVFQSRINPVSDSNPADPDRHSDADPLFQSRINPVSDSNEESLVGIAGSWNVSIPYQSGL